MRVALLTGGGDCPGLNAVIYAAVKKGINHYGDEFIGFLNGWRGVLDNNFIPLTLENIDGIQLKGGTILHSSRTNVKKIPGGIEKVQEVLKLNKVDALIALGGDDTQSVTLFLSEHGVPSVGVPKTIDNDINGTDTTFGYDTAVSIATEAVDRIHTTADSHNRVVVIEVMGRDAGWIAYASGIAGGAHVILVPEKEIDIDHVCALLKYNYDHGKHYGVVVCPPPTTACSASATASMPSIWFTTRSGVASPFSTAPTSPTSPLRKRLPAIAVLTSASLT